MGSKIQESARSPLLMLSSSSSPSFSSYSSSSSRLAEIAARVVREVGRVSDPNDVQFIEERSGVVEGQEQGNLENADNEVDEEEFEFCFVQGEPDVTADEMFDNGQIRPLYCYPVFNTQLLLDPPDPAPSPALAKRLPLGKLFMREESREWSSSSSEAEELEGLESGSYCLWNPSEGRSKTASPGMRKKSNSTGSVSKRWKLRDLILRRSNSEGKEKGSGGSGKNSTYHVVLFHHNPSGIKKTGRETGQPVVQGLGVKDLVCGDKRRSSYLPYRQGLVGLVSNVNGLSRNTHPF